MLNKNSSGQGVLGDIEAHQHAMSQPIREIVRELVDLLGATLVATIGGVNETRAVAQWMADREPQRPQGLRFALQLARMTSDDDPAVVRAWFQGSNPHLGDRSPAMMLRNLPINEIQADMMAAARAFAARRPPMRPSQVEVQHPDT